MTDIIIIGAGPAGLTAAIYALRYGMSAVIFEGEIYGGQVAVTSEVENYPAIHHITGFDFASTLYEQAKRLNVDFRAEEVTRVELLGETKSITTEMGVYYGRTVILACGAKRRKLHCPGEEEFTGKGVSYCATCDGSFFKGKEVAVVGGGNTALEEALFLSNLCSKVTMIHRRDAFRGMSALVRSVEERENIKILWNSEVKAIEGEDKVASIKVETKGKGVAELPASAVFIAVGSQPDNSLFAPAVDLDKAGYIIAGEDCRTNMEGVYAAGDCRTKELRQIVTATADGAVAAYMAANHLNQQ